MDNPFRCFNSSPEVIRLAVMMYIRYPLSLRQVEDLLFERNIDICHETVRFWWNRFGPMFAAEKVDATGEPVRGGRRINEAEAAAVRRIYAEFAAGKGPRAIARDLNAEAIPGPGGRPWGDTTIRGHALRHTGILRNDLYIGRLIWNKQRYVKDPDSGRRLARLNPESAWVVEEVPELRIVDQVLWEKVQARLGAIRRSPGVEKARARKFWLNRRPRHLLTGLVHCGACGGKFASVGKDYLACGSARRHGICENRRGILRATLEGLILDSLKTRLMAPELVKVFIEEFHAEVNRHRQHRELEQTRLRRELDEVGRRLDGLYDAIADGLRTPGLKVKLEELEHRKVELEHTLSKVPTPAPRLHPSLADLYRRKVEHLRDALAEPDTRDEALGLLRGLVDRVVMRPVEGGFEIELVSEIANMVELSAGAESSQFDDYRSSVKVVAGARNRLYLLLFASNLPLIAG